MNTRLRKIVRLSCGWILLILGFIGLFLPILQGTLMMLAGAALLGWDLKPLKEIGNRFVTRLKQYFHGQR